MLGNLVTFLKIQDNISEGTWFDIPYPSGFTKDNSIVIATQTGSVASMHFCFKLKTDRTKYAVSNLKGNSPDFAFYLIFLKTS